MGAVSEADRIKSLRVSGSAIAVGDHSALLPDSGDGPAPKRKRGYFRAMKRREPLGRFEHLMPVVRSHKLNGFAKKEIAKRIVGKDPIARESYFDRLKEKLKSQTT